MQTYLVGGALRDELLGLPVTERDYVVVGATPEEMESQGYRAVGKDFPVFLHPDTNEDYALARTERKVSRGHRGFVCHASPEVTLTDDLLRRDLTINAIARDEAGAMIDPYGGLADLKARSLRHVSAAFAEDPLRVLRLARFKAKLHHLGFEVASSTRALAGEMVAAGMLDELPAERILGELDKALGTPSPAEFFLFLSEAGAHAQLWPEIALAWVQQLAKASELQGREARLAYLFREATPETARSFCRRLHCSKKRTALLAAVTGHFHDWCRLPSLSPSAVQALLGAVDGYRKKALFLAFNHACAQLLDADQPGKGKTLADRWQQLLAVSASVSAKDVDPGASGTYVGAAIDAARLARITAQLTAWAQP